MSAAKPQYPATKIRSYQRQTGSQTLTGPQEKRVRKSENKG